MRLTTDALIIRENNNIGEADRFVTALTREVGVVHASARGAQRVKSRLHAATSLLTYSRMTLFQGRKQYMVDEAAPLKVFFHLIGDIERLALAQYFCELAGVLCPEQEPAETPLRLLLNALYLLDEGTRDPRLVKAAVELRMMTVAGYMPTLGACARCGTDTDGGAFFDLQDARLLCRNCGDGGGNPFVSAGVLSAMRHIAAGPFERVFSFSLPDEGLRQLGEIAERYLLCRLQRGFKTLDFYHSL